MAVSCDPNALLEAAKCYKCIPVGMQNPILIYLLSESLVVEGGTAPTIQQLLDGAKCYKCIPKETQEEVIIYLLCNLTGEIEGTLSNPPVQSQFSLGFSNGSAYVMVSQSAFPGTSGFIAEVRAVGNQFWTASYSDAPGVVVSPLAITTGVTYEARILLANSLITPISSASGVNIAVAP